ncbi:MAG: hypothetical protein M1826_002750 [Phylliscum demangeonii]|nr:MAG: hypothetical protein M1826_002750 [Phylliscum demangeonii]
MASMEKGSRSAQQRARNAEARKVKLAAVEAAKPVEERLLHRRDLADPVTRQFSAPRETALTRIQTWFEEFLGDEHVRRCETTEEAAQYFRPGARLRPMGLPGATLVTATTADVTVQPMDTTNAVTPLQILDNLQRFSVVAFFTG